MRFKSFFLECWKRCFFPALHDELDELPVYLWWKAEKSDIKKTLLLNSKSKLLLLFPKSHVRYYLDEQFGELNDDFMDHFGFSAEHQERLDLIAKIQIYKSTFVRTGSHYWTTKIMRTEIELEALTRDDVKLDEYKMLIRVKRALGGQEINPRVVSVIEYYSMQQEAVEVSEAAAAERNKVA